MAGGGALSGGDVVLAGAGLAGREGRFDIAVSGGRIASIRPEGASLESGARHECDGGLVLACFADIHTHLDKGHIWPRKPNPDGSFMGALGAVSEDRVANWSAEDVRARFSFSLRAAHAHGTAAIRTHLDSIPPQDAISWEVFSELRAEWAGRIELQAVALVGPDDLLERDLLRRLAERIKPHDGRLGGAIAVHPESRQAMLNVVEIAGEYGLDVDLHCDETGDPASMALRHLADAVIETGYEGRVLAGHCCVLAAQEEKVARATIDRVAEAGIAVVSLPMCNLYLQDRGPDPRTPRWRGVTLLRELRAAGVPVAVASDNTRDPFYAYGDLDPLEVLRETARIVHVDHPQDEAFGWLGAMGAEAAEIAGFAHRARIEEGAPADLVLTRARNWTELFARPQSDRIVLRDGVAIDTTLPDYRELDGLMSAQHRT